MKESDRVALSIYVVAGRDPIDAIEMLGDCNDWVAVDMLLQMLTGKGSTATDRELNAIFVGPVSRRLDQLLPARPQ